MQRLSATTIGCVACVVLGGSTLSAMQTHAAAQRSHVVMPRGIYLYRELLTNDAQFDQALGVPGVDGMALVLDWSAIQPSRDAFDTATIDSQVTLARQHKMPVELVVRAGKSVPEWVAPQAHLKLAYAPHQGVGACSPVSMPPPWNPNFQNAFADVVKRTAEYVRAQHVEIAVVKLTGINATSEELRLPAETTDATKDCPGGPVDDVKVWQTVAHYTPSKLRQAFGQLAASFDRIFPDTPVTIALIPGGAFPPIDESQRIVSGKQAQALNTQVLDSLVAGAAKSLAGRLILQHDFLMYRQPANPVVVDLARAHDLHVAWQTNLWRGNAKEGAACGGSPGNGTVCTDAQYLNLLETGVHPAGGKGASAQGLYIEVFPYDALAHQSAIAKVHKDLTDQR